MLLRLTVLIICLGTWGLTGRSQEKSEDITARIRQIEASIELLRGQLEKLKQEVAPSESITAPHQTAKSAPPAEKQEKKPTTGIELGPVNLTPYGTVYLNLFGNSGSNNNSDVPLFATPAGSGNIGGTVRQTRFGLRFTGPKIKQATTSGTVEADFYGGFPAIGIGENFGLVRVRLAYIKAEWKETALIVGQDWVPFAPVNPVSLASAAIPEMATSGNLWTRTPQIRMERRWRNGNILWQGAILSPASGDFPSGTASPALLQPGTGAASKFPYLQSRFSINDKNWFGLKKPGSIGLSGLYGHEKVGQNTHEVETVGVALDWNLPLTKQISFSGEGFFGRGLAGFQGGVFQGVVNDFAYRRGSTLVGGGPRALGTRGGWAQIGVIPSVMQNRLSLYATLGQDDPRDEDLINLARRDARARNQAYSFSSIYKWSPQWNWGLEWRRTITTYLQSGRYANNHLNLSAAYTF